MTKMETIVAANDEAAKKLGEAQTSLAGGNTELAIGKLYTYQRMVSATVQEASRLIQELVNPK